MWFIIPVDPWWWPLLIISGVLPSSPRYVALEDGVVRVRLGWLETRLMVAIGPEDCMRAALT